MLSAKLKHAVFGLFVAVVAAGAIFATAPAQASPFCTGFPGGPAPSCIYDDLNQCKRDASQQQGYCTVNFKEFTNLPRYGTICLVDNSRTVSCPYRDFATCNLDAGRNKGICFYKYNQKDPTKPVPSPMDPTLTDLTRPGLIQPVQ